MSVVTMFDAGGPRARRRNAVMGVVFSVVFIGVAIWVVVELARKGQLDPAKWQPFLTAELWTNYLLPGLGGTLLAAVLAVTFATILGILLGVGRLSKNRLVSAASATIIELFRATPMLILMIFLFQVFADGAVFPSAQLALAAVVVALTLGNGAVIAEIVRAGVRALPRGQSEAATALGLSRGKTMRLILLPQALTAMLPTLISQAIIALKDTALGYQITYLEIVRQGVLAGSTFNNYLQSLLVVAVIVVLINLALSQLATRVERRLRRRRRTAAPVESAEEPEPLPQP